MGDMGFIFDLAITALVAGIAGMVCRKLQLSVVVGYLAAGMIIGPFTPPFQLVQDVDRIRMLADLGLIFLIFGIGLGFSLQRMQRLGASVLLATGLTALLVLLGCRLVSSMLGFSDQQGLFIAAVLMVSSSAVISKVLEEAGTNHTRPGQMSLGVTLLEDIVAVVMLTLLSSLSNLSGEGESSLWQTITSFTGFVALFSLVVLLLVPRLLRWLMNVAPAELVMLLVTGLLLFLGWLAAELGYSMALTAFILGAIIGSTPHRPDVDGLFEGMRHLFGAVFFVAMGMMFDVRLLPEFWPGLLGLAAAAFFLRIPAAAIGLTIVGNNLRDALRAALTLTPLGEFSFVIAFLGVQTGVMPEAFYPAAVGASLLTCVLSPVVIRRAEPLSEGIERRIPRAVVEAIGAYRRWLDRLQSAREKSIAWKLMAPRVAQTTMQVLVVGGCLALAAPLYRALRDRVGPDLLFTYGTPVMFFTLLGALLLPALVAVWRNISALAMIAAEATAGERGSAAAKGLIERAFISAAIVLAVLWLSVLIPADVVSAPLIAVILAALLALTALFWRNLIRWHSRLEVSLQQELLAARSDIEDNARQWNIPDFENESDWQLEVREVTLPTNALHAGKSIMDLRLRSEWGSSVMGIDRHGFAINNPLAQDRLYPGDRLLLLGRRDALTRTAAFLTQTADHPAWLQQFEELGTEYVTVPRRSSYAGHTLADLDLSRTFRIQVGAIRRAGQEIASPDGRETILEGDQLLVLGAHENVRAFSEALQREKE